MRPAKPFAVLAVATALASACGSPGGGPSNAGPRHVNLSFVYANAAVNATQEMAMGARAAARETPGVTFTEVAPPPGTADESVEVGLFRGAARTATDGVALQTSTPDAFGEPLRDAHASGLPLVAVDTPPPPSTGVDTYIGNSNYQIGKLLGTEMLDAIPAGSTGQVVVGTAIPGFPVLDQRLTGMMQVIKQQRPTVQIVGPFETHLAPKDNMAAWSAAVKQYPDALAYLASSGVDAVSLAEIQRQTGRHLVVGACNLEPAALRAVSEGLVYALVSPEHWLKGYLAIRLLARHGQRGTALPRGWWNPGALVVDRANVDEITARQRDEESRRKWFDARVEQQLAHPSSYLSPLSAAT